MFEFQQYSSQPHFKNLCQNYKTFWGDYSVCLCRRRCAEIRCTFMVVNMVRCFFVVRLSYLAIPKEVNLNDFVIGIKKSTSKNWKKKHEVSLYSFLALVSKIFWCWRSSFVHVLATIWQFWVHCQPSYFLLSINKCIRSIFIIQIKGMSYIVSFDWVLGY